MGIVSLEKYRDTLILSSIIQALGNPLAIAGQICVIHRSEKLILEPLHEHVGVEAKYQIRFDSEEEARAVMAAVKAIPGIKLEVNEYRKNKEGDYSPKNVLCRLPNSDRHYRLSDFAITKRFLH